MRSTVPSLLISALFLVTSCRTPTPSSATASPDREPTRSQPAPDPEPARGQPSMRVLAKGSYGTAASGSDLSSSNARQPKVEIAIDPATYQNLWATYVGSGNPPPVDFASESAVFLALGVRPTGGYSIEPREARLDGGIARVTAPVNVPEPGGIATQAFTAPYAVVAVSAPGVEAAEWIDRDGKLVARGQRRVAR
jgi:hypothetical protein